MFGCQGAKHTQAHHDEKVKSQPNISKYIGIHSYGHLQDTQGQIRLQKDADIGQGAIFVMIICSLAKVPTCVNNVFTVSSSCMLAKRSKNSFTHYHQEQDYKAHLWGTSRQEAAVGKHDITLK